MIGNAPKAYHTGVPGWETLNEQSLLMFLARSVPLTGEIVEIGSEFGMSASLFLYAKPKPVKLTCIDIQGDWEPFYSNLEEGGFDPRNRSDLVVMKGSSHILGKTWNRDVDLVFIDGDHSYLGALTDVKLWAPHVKVGGRIVFHDSATYTNPRVHPSHRDVARAITDWAKGVGSTWKFLISIDSMEVFERIE